MSASDVAIARVLDWEMRIRQQYGPEAVDIIERINRERQSLTPQAIIAQYEALERDSHYLLSQGLLLAHPAVQGERNLQPGQLTDAHRFTVSEIRAKLPLLIGIDNRQQFSSANMPSPIVLKEVLEFVGQIPGNPPNPNPQRIQFTFSRFSNATICRETGVNVSEVVSRSWTLAKKLGQGSMGEIVTVLDDNIRDGGQCIPGLVARLYPPYAKMIRHMLELCKEANNAPINHPVSAVAGPAHAGLMHSLPSATSSSSLSSASSSSAASISSSSMSSASTMALPSSSSAAVASASATSSASAVAPALIPAAVDPAVAPSAATTVAQPAAPLAAPTSLSQPLVFSQASQPIPIPPARKVDNRPHRQTFLRRLAVNQTTKRY